MLTVLCFRSEETAEKPFLEALSSSGKDLWSAIRPTYDRERSTHADRSGAAGALVAHRRGQGPHDARWRGSPFVSKARYRGPPRRPLWAADLRRCSRRGSMRLPDARGFLETLAICGRPMAPDPSSTPAELLASASRSSRCSARPTGFAAAPRRGSRRPRSDSRNYWRRTWLPTRCAGFTASSFAGSCRDAVKTSRHRSSTIKGLGRLRTRRFRRVMPPRKRAPPSPSIERLRSIGTRCADARLVGRPRVANRARPRARHAGRPPRPPRPTSRRRPRVERIGRAPAARGRTVPDRRAHRSRPGFDSQRPERCGHQSGSKPARRAVLVIEAAGEAMVARARLYFKASRSDRRRRTPSHRHLLVGGVGIGHGGRDQRL